MKEMKELIEEKEVVIAGPSGAPNGHKVVVAFTIGAKGLMVEACDHQESEMVDFRFGNSDNFIAFWKLIRRAVSVIVGRGAGIEESLAQAFELESRCFLKFVEVLAKLAGPGFQVLNCYARSLAVEPSLL